ncbi:MAG TPA: hypothetical protein VGR52_10755 [Stellaceae bacterium]|nr:hypothetical protein [Stellaceae bacterium]
MVGSYRARVIAICSGMVGRLSLRRADCIPAATAVCVFLVAIAAGSAADRILFGPQKTSKTTTVEATEYNREIRPYALTVERGTVVRINNAGPFIHHLYVKSPTMNFDSGDELIGQSVNVEFDHSGVFNVQCSVHPTTHLLVFVK